MFQLPEAKLLDECVESYRQKKRRRAHSIANKLIARGCVDFLPFYVSALCLARSGKEEKAVERMRHADDLNTVLANYDIRRAALAQRGKTSWLDVHEERLRQWHIFHQTDSFLVSYPKCGRTWVRYMLGLLGRQKEQEDPMDVFAITSNNPILRTTEISHDNYPQWLHHSNVPVDKNIYQQKHVVFLVREPKDALISAYFRLSRSENLTKRKQLGYDESVKSITDFIWGDVGGLKSIVAYYNSWAQARTVPEMFTCVTYEKLKKDTAGELRRVVAGLGWPEFDEAEISNTVSLSSFENMRKLEESQSRGQTRLGPNKPGDPDSFKVRSGKVGGYTEHLTPEEAKKIQQYIDENLDSYFDFYKTA